MHQKHILHTEASLGFGGQERRILKEALAFLEKGHRITIAAPPESLLFKKAKNTGIATLPIKFGIHHWPFSLYRLSRFIFKEKVDVVHTHSSKDSWLAGILGRFFRKTVLRTRHISSKIRGGLNAQLLYGILPHHVITTAKETKHQIEKIVKKKNFFCTSVPTGVDPSIKKENHQNFKKEYNIPENMLLVGTLCVLRSWKGVDLLLKSAFLLKDRPIFFVIAGSGPQEERLKNLAQQLGLKNCLFTGHLENPEFFLEALDIFCLLSTDSEGVSQSALQAAFFKKPLLTTSTGGLKEICIPQETGLITDPNPIAIAHSLLFMEKEKEKRTKWGENAHNLVKKQFLWAQTMENLEDILMQAESTKI